MTIIDRSAMTRIGSGPTDSPSLLFRYMILVTARRVLIAGCQSDTGISCISADPYLNNSGRDCNCVTGVASARVLCTNVRSNLKSGTA